MKAESPSCVSIQRLDPPKDELHKGFGPSEDLKISAERATLPQARRSSRRPELRHSLPLVYSLLPLTHKSGLV